MVLTYFAFLKSIFELEPSNLTSTNVVFGMGFDISNRFFCIRIFVILTIFRNRCLKHLPRVCKPWLRMTQIVFYGILLS